MPWVIVNKDTGEYWHNKAGWIERKRAATSYCYVSTVARELREMRAAHERIRVPMPHMEAERYDR